MPVDRLPLEAEFIAVVQVEDADDVQLQWAIKGGATGHLLVTKAQAQELGRQLAEALEAGALGAP